MKSKDIVLRERFTFAPNFRKAVAHALGQETVSDATIRAWIQKTVEDAETTVSNAWYDFKRDQKFEAHRAADPHCTCNDCIDYMEKHTLLDETLRRTVAESADETRTVHACEVQRRGRFFIAQCPCGWFSRDFDTHADAYRDANDHIGAMVRANL